MNKNIVIKIMQWSETAAILSIIITGIIIYLTNMEPYSKGLGLGIAIGALIGGIIRVFVVVPKQFGNKDERTLSIEILAELISLGFIFVFVYIVFVLTMVELIDSTIANMFNAVVGMVITKLVTLLISRKIIERVY